MTLTKQLHLVGCKSAEVECPRGYQVRKQLHDLQALQGRPSWMVLPQIWEVLELMNAHVEDHDCAFAGCGLDAPGKRQYASLQALRCSRQLPRSRAC